MRLYFHGNAPDQNYVRLGVRGDNLTTPLEMFVANQHSGVRLSDYTVALKIQNADRTFVDKITAELSVETTTESGCGEFVKIVYTPTDAVTRCGSVDMQLEFAKYGDEVVPVWQSQIFNVSFDLQIEADEIIAQKYPDALRDLEKRVTAVENAPTFTEYVSFDKFPPTGKEGEIYVDTSDDTTYRWNGKENRYEIIGFNPDQIKIINANGGM